MKIRLLQPIAGERFSLAPGCVVDWDDPDAHRLIAAGIAEPVGAPLAAPESAMLDPAIERAMLPRARPRRAAARR